MEIENNQDHQGRQNALVDGLNDVLNLNANNINLPGNPAIEDNKTMIKLARLES